MSFGVAAIFPHPADMGVAHAVLERGEFSFPTLAARNDSSTNNTVNLFINGASPNMKYAGSIVSACVDQTVYAVRCTSGPELVGTVSCGSDAPVRHQNVQRSPHGKQLTWVSC